jgi:opacity protein-like surface antigen
MKKELLIASCLVMAGSSAFAQSASFVPGFYAGVELGYARVEDQTQETASALVGAFGGSVTVTQDLAIFDGRIFGGYKVTENISLEVGYAQSSSATTTASGRTGGSVAYTGSGEVSYSGFDFSVLLRPSMSTGFNNLFLRAGGTSLTQETSLSVSAGGTSASATDSTSGMGYILGVGYDFPINKTLDVRVAYNYLGNIAGESNNYANRFSIGLLGKF